MQSQVDETRISAKIMLKLSGGASRTIHRLGQAPAGIWTSEKRSAELTHPLKGRSRSLHLICAGLSLAMSDYHAAQHTFAHVTMCTLPFIKFHRAPPLHRTAHAHAHPHRLPRPGSRDMSPIDSSVRSSCAFWKKTCAPVVRVGHCTESGRSARIRVRCGMHQHERAMRFRQTPPIVLINLP